MSYTRRFEVASICREMDRLVGGHYFSEVRSCSCDSDGYWQYYVSQVCHCPHLSGSVDSLYDEAVSNLLFRGVLHA